MRRIFPYIFLLLLASCAKPAPAEIDRLEAAAVTDDKLPDTTLLDRFGPALDVLGHIYGVSTADSAMSIYSSSAAQRVFGPDILRIYPTLDTLELQLGAIRDNLKESLPSLIFPTRIITFATPYNQSIIIADSTLMIALNHYLGECYEGYRSFERYQRTLKTRTRIPMDVAEAVIASAYPYKPRRQPTVLSRILYEGALLHGVADALPEKDEATLLGFTPEEYHWATENHQRAWQTLIEADLLYSSDQGVIDRLLLPSPSTSVINPNAPGRLGRFIGYEMVKSYLKNNDGTTTGQLLDSDFYDSMTTLKDAHYNP